MAATLNKLEPERSVLPWTPLHPTIFHEPWWLDAATGERWEEVTARSGGRDVGRLVFLRQPRWGMAESVMPALTPLLGPAIDVGAGRLVHQRHRERSLTLELIAQLPKVSRFHQRLHPGLSNSLPFLESGYRSEAEFTFEIEPQPTEILWRGMRDQTRNRIRRGAEQGRLADLEPDAFIHFYSANLERRGKAFNYMWRTSVKPVFQAMLDRGRGRLLAIVDAAGTPLASIMTVWDRAVTYLILMTRAPGTHSGLMSLLIWEAIKDSAAQGRVFDFGGVGSYGSILFYSGFGGAPQPRYVVRRSTLEFRAVDLFMRKVRGLRGKVLAPALKARHDQPAAGARPALAAAGCAPVATSAGARISSAAPVP